MPPESTPGTQTLFRGLAVLEAVACGARDLSALCRALGLSRSTTQRLASALVKAGYLRGEGDGYALGAKLIELGFQAREQVPLARLARPHLEALAERTQDTVHLGLPDGAEVLYLDKIPGQRGLEMRSRIGHRMPMAMTGVGKALMLDLPEDRWRALYENGLAHPASRGSPRPWEAYRDEMRRYATQSVALDFAENEIGIHCVAAPVRDAGRGIVAAVSLASAAQHMPEERMLRLVPEVAATAEAISRSLGWRAAAPRAA
ncbi:IclR family transcriptional regulator [Roseomonas gilardii]|uniref:IclR family transcriptional regulator n=1 Tax=Roseomonas gilardii TaxID=257708 RepID=A0ABU3MEC9_9PROT|nr:IclR family transcriptional regulator [Roseomonas gilardii]MDT8331182.1 IclR family transcriptional regulator [Roseomonas gilardii]PZR15759.1 MAG: transcriptional regulator [Azospirillum brasilense]